VGAHNDSVGNGTEEPAEHLTDDVHDSEKSSGPEIRLFSEHYHEGDAGVEVRARNLHSEEGDDPEAEQQANLHVAHGHVEDGQDGGPCDLDYELGDVHQDVLLRGHCVAGQRLAVLRGRRTR